jgi:hypothetical protein
LSSQSGGIPIKVLLTGSEQDTLSHSGPDAGQTKLTSPERLPTQQRF